MNAAERLFALQREHRDLVSDLLRDERTALIHAGRHFRVDAAALPSSRIVLPTSSPFKTALEFKIWEAVDLWENFWKPRASDAIQAVRELAGRKLLIQREYSTEWVHPTFFLLYDVICVPVDFFFLRAIIPAWSAYDAIVEYVDICSKIAEYIELDGDVPALVFVPSWEPPYTTTPQISQLAKELACDVVRECVGYDRKPSVEDSISLLDHAIRRDAIDYQPLHHFLALDTVEPHIANPLFQSDNRAFYNRLIRRQSIPSDAEDIVVVIASFFSGLYREEKLPAALAASLAVEPNQWAAFIHRAKYIAQIWQNEFDLPSDRLLTHAFDLSFPWLSQLHVADLRQIRATRAGRAFRETVARHTDELRHVTADVDEFRRHLTTFETAVVRSLADQYETLKSEVAIARRSRNLTAVSFGLTLTLGAASILFPPLAAITIPTALFSTVVGSASIRDLVRAQKQSRTVDPECSAFTLLLPRLS